MKSENLTSSFSVGCKLTVRKGKSKKKKRDRMANIDHKNAISKPGELCIVTRMSSNRKFVCFNNIVKHGPIKRPI